MNMCRILILLFTAAVCVMSAGVGAAEEYNGEVVSINGLQTDTIIWNAFNFSGFNYGPNDNLSTETLTIAPYSLNGPDADRLIEAGNLTYATSAIWREYSVHKDMGLFVNYNDDGYQVVFLNGEKYVAIEPTSIDKLGKPQVEFDSDDIKTFTTGEAWNICRGFTLVARQVDISGDKVWFQLYENGVFLDDKIIDVGCSNLQGRVWTYTEDVAGEIDVPILSLYVSGIMRGTDTAYVQVKYLSLIDNSFLQISLGDRFDNMEVQSIGSTLELSNWDDLYLNSGSGTSQIMGNLSFITVNNASSIEFYPNMVREEIPVLSGGGGFVSASYSEIWNLSEGYAIALQEISPVGNKAMFALLKDNVIIDQRILTENYGAPVNSDSYYQYIQNGTEIINATLEYAFYGTNSKLAKLAGVYQRSEIDGGILLENSSHVFKPIDSSGILWDLLEGYTLTMKDISVNGDEVWFELSKNGVIVKDEILNENLANTLIYSSGKGNISYLLDGVILGNYENAVEIKDVDQYSEVSGDILMSNTTHFYKTGDPSGIPWSLSNGYVLSMKDIDTMKSEKVWLDLSKDGNTLAEGITRSGGLFTHANGLETFDCTVVGVMYGTLTNVAKIVNVNLCSDAGMQIVQNGSKTFATADPSGAILKIFEGYSLDPKDVSRDGNKIWLSLSKDDTVVKDEIIDTMGDETDRWFRYYNSTGPLVFSTYVDEVFCGMVDNLVVLRNTIQYSEINGTLLFQSPNQTTLRAGITLNDITPPSLTITSPASGTTVTTSTITVSGTASDESGIANVMVNGILATGTTDWSADVTLTEGANMITVVATDKAGVIATQSITVTYTPSSISGDLNDNGMLDTGDVTLALRMAVGLVLPDMLGDMNGNGFLDTGDATLILRTIDGLA